ncbi:signal transduction histidine kinase [Streptomyces achromogenes]|uniref:histidine kinase n=1 Tax=Streptomyces achromogenes TaxID=67255 RepID=A0ABU0PYI5_STRAH|nr:ATP-binding protein [Streptomyces achromogenes]MDQ0682710.1 signal transduction histidine kinase [Streptomyces achromogenes]MDQ0829911.1 signal transduction histidine kinase [Streptomyces achromogenes]
MVSVQSPPGRRELPLARVLLLPAILMAAATGAAVALVAAQARFAVGVCGGVATLLVIAAGAESVRRGRQLRELRAERDQRLAYLERRVADHTEENRRLAQEHVPSAVSWLRAGNSPREVMRDLSESDPSFRELDDAQRAVVRRILDIVDHEESLRDSAQRSFVSVARRVQAIVHQQSAELREMEEDHGRNPEVFDDLLRIDHGTSLIGRLADSIGVLGGGRPGRNWPQPVPLYSVLRGAMSRILEYRRIQLDSIAKVNIRGLSVEPLIHALAELLDNATRYSPPNSKVHVNAVEVQTGIAIEIEDAGVSLSEEARAKAERMLEQAKAGVDIQDVGGTPRLGLAVVGRLCTSFNLQVSLRTSAYGGVRAVLIVPSEMQTSDPAPGFAHGIGATAVPQIDLSTIGEGPKRPPKKRRPTNARIPAGVSLTDDVPEVTEWTEQGLPQRRSKTTIPITQRYAEAYAAQEAAREGKPDLFARPEPEPDPEPKREPGLAFEAFWEGLKKAAPPGVHPTDFTRNPTAYLHLLEDKAKTEADDEGDPT